MQYNLRLMRKAGSNDKKKLNERLNQWMSGQGGPTRGLIYANF